MTTKSRTRATKKTVKHAESRLDALRDDLDALRKSGEAIVGDVGGLVNEQTHRVIKTAEGVAERALLLAEEAATETSQMSVQFADGVESWTNENLEGVRDSVREKPLGSLFLAFGIGVVLAKLLSL